MIERIHELKENIHDYLVTVVVFCGALFFTVSAMVLVVAVVLGSVAFFKGGL